MRACPALFTQTCDVPMQPGPDTLLLPQEPRGLPEPEGDALQLTSYTGNLAASPVCSPKELLSVHGNWPKKDFFSSPSTYIS